MNRALARQALAEAVGTAFLLMAVVGSGIAASRLSPDDTGLQLLENALVTGAALVAILCAIGPVSGAHLNPIVTMVDRWFGGISTGVAATYCAAQVIGAALGVMVANVMFDLDPIEWSTKIRDSGGQVVGEAVAVVGLLLVVFGVARSGRRTVAPFAVGAYVTAAYFFTSSTSFANPAVTLARTLSDSFSGIEPGSVPGFLGGQAAGAVIAVAVIAVLYPRARDVAADLVVPRPTDSVARGSS
ncbi:MAG: aquaporin family protein [Acidimicrobiia bacterium]|nr:aquaporin family protein [Acidimicrobiia bacterium]